MDEFEIDGRRPIYIVPEHSRIQDLDPDTLEPYEVAEIDDTRLNTIEPYEATASIATSASPTMEFEIPIYRDNDVDLCMSCAYDSLSCDSSGNMQIRFYGQGMNVCCCPNYKPLWSQMPEFQCGYEQAMRELNSPQYVDVLNHYNRPPTYDCPRCKSNLNDRQDENRCPHCGQKLNWNI